MTEKKSVEKTVREIGRKTRKKYSVEEKIRIAMPLQTDPLQEILNCIRPAPHGCQRGISTKIMDDEEFSGFVQDWLLKKVYHLRSRRMSRSCAGSCVPCHPRAAKRFMSTPHL